MVDILDENIVLRMIELEAEAESRSEALQKISTDHAYGLLLKDRRKLHTDALERKADQNKESARKERESAKARKSLLDHYYEDETDPDTGLPKALNTILDGSAFSRSKYTSARSFLSKRNDKLLAGKDQDEEGKDPLKRLGTNIGLKVGPSGKLEQVNLHEHAGVHIQGRAASRKSPVKGYERPVFPRSPREAGGSIERFFGPRGDREKRIQREEETLRIYGEVSPPRCIYLCRTCTPNAPFLAPACRCARTT